MLFLERIFVNKEVCYLNLKLMCGLTKWHYQKIHTKMTY